MGKSKNKITNWPEYNRALTQRGSITLWVDESAIEAWTCTKHHGKSGRGFHFSLMNVPLRSPNYSSISKRAKTVEIKYRNQSRGAIRHIAIDSTGLKVFGEGEWKVKKHGSEKRRMWRKLHLAVDVDTHEIISAEMTLVNAGDSEVRPTLLNPLISLLKYRRGRSRCRTQLIK